MMSQPTLDETALPGAVGLVVEPAPTPAKKGKQSTEYVILSESKTTAGTWTVIGPWQGASSANAAIREHLKAVGAKEKDGTYVAVPARSWQPVTVKTETTTKLTLT